MNELTTKLTTPQWRFEVVVESDLDDGGYIVHCPALKGCWSQGETVDEALHNIADAISGWLTVHIERSLNQAHPPTSETATLPLRLSVEVP